MQIRRAQVNDVAQIANVHFLCFPDSFSTVLGKGSNGLLLRNYYLEYLEKVPELFYVAEKEGKIVGFCMGYYCEDWDYTRSFLKNNFVRIVARVFVLLVTFNKLTWRKLFSFVFPRSNAVKGNSSKVEGEHDDLVEKPKCKSNQCGELLSICVLPNCRGTGLAGDLVDQFVDALRKGKRKVVRLTVLDDNGRGKAFYKRLGFLEEKRTGSSIHMLKVIG